MLGFQIDALDPTLVAIGIVVGSVTTFFVMRRVEKRQNAR